MPPPLVAENTEDLSDRGQSRGQTSAGGGREPLPVCVALWIGVALQAEE